MVMSINIRNIFSIGYRCNSDEFLTTFLNIRKYSSPFSYMVIDIKTALDFIDTEFVNYTNKEYILPGKNTYKFNNNKWKCTNIHKNSVIENDYMDILDVDTVCIWNHHHLYDQKTIDSFNRRSFHLLDCLSKTPETTLLLYIEKFNNTRVMIVILIKAF